MDPFGTTRPRRSPAMALVALSFVLLTLEAALASRVGRCKRACRDEIAACVGVGNRPRACRRSMLRRCRREGLAVCERTPTTSTTLRVATTSTTRPTTTLPSTTTSTTLATTSTSATSTSSSTTTSTSLPPPPADLWTIDGPIRWSTVPPAEVVAADEFPLALDVDVPAASVEIRVRSCSVDVPPEQCPAAVDPRTHVRVDPEVVTGPPGRFTVTGAVVVGDDTCVPDETAYVVAEVTVVDAQGGRHGPFPSPLAPVRVRAKRILITSAFSTKPTNSPPIAFFAIAGQDPVASTLSAQVYCTGGALVPVTASADAPWLSLAQQSPYTFLVTADARALDPGGGPYHATITVRADDPAVLPVEVLVTLHVTPLVMRWVTPPPETLHDGETAPLALEVLAPADRVRVRLRTRSGAAGLDLPVTFDPGAELTGPPGTLTGTLRRGTDCVRRLDAELAADVWLENDGAEVGPFPFPPAPFEFARGDAAQTLTYRTGGWGEDGDDLVFRTVAGGLPMPRELLLSLACADRAPTQVDWTITTDVPWLSLSETSGTAYAGGGYGPRVDVNAGIANLDPAASPHAGHLVVTAPGVSNSPLVLPVELHIDGDIHVGWQGPSPGTVDVGDRFPVELAITGDFARVAGHAQACDDRPPICLFDFASWNVGLTGAGRFDGPPGRFAFTGSRWASCLYDIGSNFLGAIFRITGDDGTERGPFYATPLPFLMPAATTFSLSPDAVTLRGLAGQRPLAATLVPVWLCGDIRYWTASVDVPWLSLSRWSGATAFAGRNPITVVADTTRLSPAGSPYHGVVTFYEVGRAAPVAIVPVDVVIDVLAE